MILLVDDDGPLRNLLRCVLQEAGYGVLTAASGEEALELSRHCAERLVLVTDINMSRMSGIELSHLIRRDRPGTPVLYISGDSNNASLTDIQCQLLLKPFRPADFLDRVTNLANEFNAVV